MGGQPGDGYIGHPRLGIKNPLAKKQTQTNTSSNTGIAGKLGNRASQMDAAMQQLRQSYKPEGDQIDEVAAWQRKEGKNPSGGLNKKGIESYRRENPGSKLSMAVTTPPSKLKPGSKSANRRKSFCARMGGVEGPMKDEKGRPTRKALALKKWNC